MPDNLDRLKTALADRYAIQEELGAGGMATVYLAEDVKHHRKVAVKVLRPELAAVVGAERFLHEIQIAANLNHPHILTLIDSGEADGFLYYVMPYVQGESLRDKLQREKQLAVEDALAITQDVASAMAYAHTQGVIHRDLKPGNILLHEGEAMVADFGLALALRAAGGQRLTEAGLSLGTPEYMSPEQATADQDVDARSDIYSLGAVLYELLAGEPPHTGRNTQVIIAKLLTEAPTPLRVLRNTVSEAVDRAVMKALAKVAPDRFATTAEFAKALAAEDGDVEAEAKSIVVLPFANLSPDPDNEYFADGLMEEVIADLSQVRSLRVISRNSAIQLKGTTKDTRTIGRDLGVKYVLEGSVRKAGNNLRITAQLIEVENDAHLWADKYNGTVDDVFDLQERLSRQIVDALRLELTPEEDRKLVERPIADLKALEYYQRTGREWGALTPEANRRAYRLAELGLKLTGPNEAFFRSARIHRGLVSALRRAAGAGPGAGQRLGTAGVCPQCEFGTRTFSGRLDRVSPRRYGQHGPSPDPRGGHGPDQSGHCVNAHHGVHADRTSGSDARGGPRGDGDRPSQPTVREPSGHRRPERRQPIRRTNPHVAGARTGSTQLARSHVPLRDPRRRRTAGGGADALRAARAASS